MNLAILSMNRGSTNTKDIEMPKKLRHPFHAGVRNALLGTEFRLDIVCDIWLVASFLVAFPNIFIDPSKRIDE